MEKNKLIEEIENILDEEIIIEHVDWDRTRLDGKPGASEKLFTLTSDVSVKFAEWYDIPIEKEMLDRLKENNLEFNIQNAFLYFINNIYGK